MSFLPGMFPAAAFMGGAVTSFAFQSASTSGASNSITLPADIQAGDLIVLHDLKVATVAPPADVVPAGFTGIGTVGGNGGAGANFARTRLSYKIAQGSDASAVVTGMTATVAAQMQAVVFRPVGSLTTITVADVETELTDGNPSAKIVNASAGATPLIVIGSYDATGTIDPRTFSPAKDGEAQGFAANQWLAWKIYNSGAAPANHTIDMDDEGDQNTLVTFYLQAA